jgi:hypothetical protein
LQMLSWKKMFSYPEEHHCSQIYLLVKFCFLNLKIFWLLFPVILIWMSRLVKFSQRQRKSSLQMTRTKGLTDGQDKEIQPKAKKSCWMRRGSSIILINCYCTVVIFSWYEFDFFYNYVFLPLAPWVHRLNLE